MFRFEEQVNRIVQALALQSMPIGVRFSESPDKRGVERRLRICEALDVARRENAVINLSKENCTCRGGSHIVGWQVLSLEEFTALFLAANVYASKKVAQDSVGKQLKPVYRGRFLILGPLGKFETDPDVVLFFINPAQADRLLGLACFEGAEPFMHYPASTVCSTISNTLAKGKPDVNLISIFERTRHKWSPDKLIVTLPFKDFMTAARNIDHSGYGKKAPS
ncbi:MAG: DUF169 domain-containing protein [Candidatus Bathyarchaeota archaeon]|nr:DUF169 domain-containing protein [Candidatus Bathyarchaeota archaeon]MDH5747176.1 DUF169 domain-containing protein [Candidatus Bathyarchaeota archaeon]